MLSYDLSFALHALIALYAGGVCLWYVYRDHPDQNKRWTAQHVLLSPLTVSFHLLMHAAGRLFML